MATRDGLVATCYSHEFRSPPVPLVALIGCPEFHKPLSEFFLHSLKPPLVSLCCNEPVEQFVPRAFSAPGSGHHAAAGQLPGKGTPGILKADWLVKHRQRRPAVALVIVHRHEMQGDPNTWNRMLYTLKFIRDAVTPRGAGMVVAVAQPAGMGELPGDRLQTVCHHLSLDPRSVVTVTMGDASQPLDEASRASRDAALHSVGLLASEQCAAYYARRAKHVSDKHSERRAMHPDGKCPPEMNARTAIKLAVYAEFRQDWRAAVNEYQAAYSHVRAIIAPPPPTPSPSTSGAGGLHASHSMPHVPNALNPLEAGARSDAYPPSPYPSQQQQQQQSSYPSSTLEPPGYGVDQAPGASPGPRKPPHHAHHASWGANAWNGAMSPSPHQVSSTGWPPGHPLSVQRFAQAARVSELLQLKLVILLAYRERLEEAAAQANSHIQFFMRPPVTLAPSAASAHAGYLIRQLQVTAEVLSSKLEGSPLAAAAKECNRATLLTSAAQVAVDRRRLLDTLASVRASQPTLDMTLVKKGPFVGTITLRMDGGSRELTDQEFLLWLEAEELRMHGLATGGSGSTGGASGTQASSPSVGVQTGLAGGAGTAVEVINAALQALPTGHTDRQRSQLVMLLAEEHVLLGSLSAARKLLLQAAHTYRRDGWGVPLAQALLLLREAAQRLRLPTEHVMYCLELSVVIATLTQADLQALSQSCSARGLTVPAAEPLAAAAVNALLTGVHDIARLPGIIKTSRGPSPEPGQSPGPPGGAQTPTPRAFNYTVEWVDLLAMLSRKAPGPGAPPATGTRQGPGAGGAADGQRPPTMADMLQRHHQQDFGWSRVLGCAVSFPADTAPDAPCADLHVALLNTLAFTLPLTGADVTLADELAGQWTVPLLPEPLQPDIPAFQPSAPPTTPPTHSTTDASSRGSHPHHGDTDHHMDQPRHAHHKHHAGTDTWEESTTKVNGHASSRAGSDDTATSDGVARALALTHLGNAAHLLPSGPMQPLDLPLHAGAWRRLATRVAPRGVGRLRVDKLTVYIGQYTSVTFMVSSFPSGPPGHVSLGGCMERLHGIDALQLCPFAHVMHMGQLAGPSINIQHVGPLPTLQLSMQPRGPAYVGEPFFIAATVTVTHGLPTSVMEFAVRPITPGMQPSHLSIMVDDRANLERYHGQDLARLQLLSVAPGASHTARLWVVARHAGRVALAVTLQCPALVTEVVEFNVEEPLSINVHLTADPANHVLVPPATPGPPGGPAPPQPLTIGQQSLAHLALRHAALAPDAAEIELLEAQVIGNPTSGVTPLAELSDQLLSADGSPLLSLHRGDVALLLAPLLPAALTPAPASLGNVQVTWRRTHRRVSGPAHTSQQSQPSMQPLGQTSGPLTAQGGPVGPPAAATAGPTQSGTAVEPITVQPATAARVALTADQLDELASQQPRPSNKVVSRLELPPVLVQEALLSARTLSPGQATAGIAFTFVCQVQNFGASQQELLVALLDAPGFVLSGDRSQQVVVPSRQAGGAVTVSWLLVAHTAGQLSLPSVRIAAPRHNATLTTQPGSVHVLPF